MGVVDFDRLVSEVSPDSPAGPYIEYGAVAELERLVAATPVSESAGFVISADNQAWQDIADKASQLLDRTKDLRVAAILARALLLCQGLGAFADGLAVLTALVTRYWDSVHPPLDGSDATFRVNAVSYVAGRETVILPLRRMPIVQSGRGARFSLRDVELSRKAAEDGEAEGERPDPEAIALAFRDSDGQGLDQLASSLQLVGARLKELDSALGEAARASAGFEDLEGTLRAMSNLVSEQRNSLGTGDGASEGGGMPDAHGEQGRGAATGSRAVGSLRSRHDVVRVLDQICGWYAANEPSSPVPLILGRAKRLVFMDFLEAVKDLSPGGVSELRNVAGIHEES